MQESRSTLQVLIVGRLVDVVEEILGQIREPDATLHGASNLDEVRRALATKPIDVMIVGAGLDISERVAIVRAAFEVSETISVHLKDRASGRAGFAPFAKQVIAAHLLHRTVS